MSVRRDLHEANRRSWNAATVAHNSHKQDQARWLATGGEALYDEDYELLGPLAGKRLVHLQCNSGQDSLCLARRGAIVTGVDISDEAVEFARTLANDSGIPAAFERADVYDWLASAAADAREFDIVYCSYGWMGWLSDLRAWARGVASVLAPGGRLVVLEFHPFVFMFDAHWRLIDSYLGAGDGEVIDNPRGVNDYVRECGGELLAPSGYVEGEAFSNPHPSHEFVWSIADLLAAVREAGLELERFEEWGHSNGYRPFAELVSVDDADGRRCTMAPGRPRVPLMLGLVAHERERGPSGR